jgi:hypothetical protein
MDLPYRFVSVLRPNLSLTRLGYSTLVSLPILMKGAIASKLLAFDSIARTAPRTLAVFAHEIIFDGQKQSSVRLRNLWYQNELP